MNGILIIDKPKGWTSYEVVSKVRKKLRLKKVGHGGTLDPIATGVLPIYLNEATKLVPFNLDVTKDYLAVLRLGQETDTYDADGKVIRETTDFHFEAAAIQEVLDRFRGTIWQVPPIYSAIKREGRPLYQRARAGEILTLPPREVVIHHLAMRSFEPPFLTLEITCGRGTYIRTLAADIGRALGCGAHLKDLRRLRSGKFRIDQALSMEEFQRRIEQNRIQEIMISLKDGVEIQAELRIDGKSARRVRQGLSPQPEDFVGLDWRRFVKGERIRLLNGAEHLVAILEVTGGGRPGTYSAAGGFRILRVFNDSWREPAG